MIVRLHWKDIAKFHVIFRDLFVGTKHNFRHSLVFNGYLDLRGNLGNVKEKPTRKTCFFCEEKQLALRIYLAKFCKATLLYVNKVSILFS